MLWSQKSEVSIPFSIFFIQLTSFGLALPILKVVIQQKPLRDCRKCIGTANLKVNQALCNICGNILTSNSQYDLQLCLCVFTAVDGGSNLRTIEIHTPLVITDGLSSADHSNLH